jgi:hypothetical protein
MVVTPIADKCVELQLVRGCQFLNKDPKKDVEAVSSCKVDI